MVSPSMVLASAVGIILLSSLVFITTGSFLSVIVLISLAGIIGYCLNILGILKINVSQSGGVDISLFEKPVAPAGKPLKHLPIEKKEVFYISGNDYTYD